MPSGTVLRILLETFEVAPSSIQATREDIRLARRIRQIVFDFDDDELDVEETDGTLSMALEHEDWNPIDEEADTSNDEIDASADTVTFSGNNSVLVESVNSALEFYRRPKRQARSLWSLQNNFRFVKTQNDLNKLRRFEKDPKSCVDRIRSIEVLSKRLQEAVFAKIDEGNTLHDADLQAMAREINEQMQIRRFNASMGWIAKFKRENGIVSRRITTSSAVSRTRE